MVLLLTAPSAYARPDHPPFAVVTPEGEGQGFAIRNPDLTPNCLVVTALHVAKAGDRVKLIALNRTQSPPQRIEIAARVVHEVSDAKLTVLAPAQNLPSCDPLRLGDAAIAEHVDQIGRTPRVIATTGEVSYARVLIEAVRVAEIELSSIGARKVESGYSGGLITFDGTPLAVVQEIDRGFVKASRLDYSRSFRERYASWPDPAASPAPLMWDVSRLPEEYRRVYASSLEVKKRAEVVQRVARDNAKLAEDADLRAASGIPGHGEVRTQTGLYRGQIANVVNGFGMLRHTSGSVIGDVHLGSWTTTKIERAGVFSFFLQGPAVIRHESNAGNLNRHRTIEAIFKNSVADGEGVLTFENGDVAWSQWQSGEGNGYVVFQRYSDGYWFTGTIRGGLWSGPGVLWDRAGQIVLWGVWKDGNPPEMARQPIR